MRKQQARRTAINIARSHQPKQSPPTKIFYYIFFASVIVLIGLAIGFFFPSLSLLASLGRTKENRSTFGLVTEQNSHIYREPALEKTLTYERIFTHINRQDYQEALTSFDQPHSLNLIGLPVVLHHNPPTNVDTMNDRRQLFRTLKIKAEKPISKNELIKQQKHEIAQLLIYGQNRSKLAKKFSDIFLTSPHANIAYYQNHPKSLEKISGQFIIANHTLRIFSKAFPFEVAAHELAHAASATITHGIKKPLDPLALATSFPCEKMDFFETVKRELESALTMGSLGLKQNLDSDEKWRWSQFINKSESFEPNIALQISRTDLAKLQIKRLRYGDEIFFHQLEIPGVPLFDDYLINIPSHFDEVVDYITLISKNPLKFLFVSPSSYSEIVVLIMTPIKIQQEIRALYFYQELVNFLEYVNSFPSGSHCQEAFGSLLQFNDKIQQEFFANSISYLWERLSSYPGIKEVPKPKLITRFSHFADKIFYPLSKNPTTASRLILTEDPAFRGETIRYLEKITEDMSEHFILFPDARSHSFVNCSSFNIEQRPGRTCISYNAESDSENQNEVKLSQLSTKFSQLFKTKKIEKNVFPLFRNLLEYEPAVAITDQSQGIEELDFEQEDFAVISMRNV